MQGEMMDYPLTTQHVMWRIDRFFQRKIVASKTAGGIHHSTYGEVLASAGRLAGALDRLGLQSGDRVATLGWNNHRHLELYYGVPNSGRVLHTLNPRIFPDQLAFIVDEAEDSSIFVDATLLPVLAKIHDRLPSSLHSIVVMNEGGGPLPDHPFRNLLDYDELIGAERSDYAWPVLDERQAAAMCYTSGTTGNPKGVVYSHRSQLLHSFACILGEGLGLTEQDCVLAVVPMFHANAWGLPYACGMVGANFALPDRWAGDPVALVEMVKSEKVTRMAGVPTVFIALLRHLEQTGIRLEGVKSAVVGGSTASPALIDRMAEEGITIYHAWGMTESSPIGTMRAIRSWLTPEEERSAAYSQGVAVPGVEIRLVDSVTGEEVPWDGKSWGEIELRGPWIASQYYKNTDPSKFTDGWLHTGDVATIDENGYVRIVDRTKDVIKSGGEWISSVDLEVAMMAHPQVLEAAVVAVPDPVWQERPLAYVVPKDEFKGRLTDEDLRIFLAERVPKWWLPERIVFIDEVPKGATGKFDKKVLRTMPVEAPAP
jgi:fatty-acyl-CoA synthase